MKFYTGVIIPGEIKESEYETFIRNAMQPFSVRIEVEPYKDFFGRERTMYFAARAGYENDLDGYERYLAQKEKDCGIENGLLYWWMTYNPLSRWDYYYDDSEKYDDINVLSAGMPAAIVTPDGVWHEYYEENNMVGNKKEEIEAVRREYAEKAKNRILFYDAMQWKHFGGMCIKNFPACRVAVLHTHF